MTPGSFEARALHARKRLDWTGVVGHSWDWLCDEPFSSRPSELGSYVAAAFLMDFSLCASFARVGLLANPHNPTLLNNLTVAFANLGRLDKAEETLKKLQQLLPDVDVEAAIIATEGLVQFRSGYPEIGRILYMSSMDLAEKRGQTLKRLLALLHLLREERRIDSDLADELLNKTEKEVMSAKSKEFIAMFDAIKLEKREDLERT